MKVGDRFTYVQRRNGVLRSASVDYVEDTTGIFGIYIISGTGVLWFYPKDEGVHWTRDFDRASRTALRAASAIADAA